MLLTSNLPFVRSQLEHVGGRLEVKSSIYWTTLPTPFKAEALQKKEKKKKELIFTVTLSQLYVSIVIY